MKNNVIAFNFGTFAVRTIDIDGEVWFVAAAVCKVLGLSNPTKAVSILDEEDRANFELGGGRTANIINESGLYTLLLRSDKPEARPFRRWVTKELLPAVRKNGVYMATETALTPDQVDAFLSQKMQIPVMDYIALKHGNAAGQDERRYLTHYTPEQRAEIIRLADEGIGPTEISEIMGAKADTVRTILFRARKAGQALPGDKQGHIWNQKVA